MMAAPRLPQTMLAWPFHGDGLDSLGVDGAPVEVPVPPCGAGEILARVDALGLCASDVKMVRQGGRYPLFFDRDFAADPAQLGHEVALTVVAVGEQWQGLYTPGQRLGLQPDVFAGGKRAIFGVNLPGGMAQYVTLGPAVLSGDHGSYLFPVPDTLSHADVAVLEPWACIDVAFSATARRLARKPGGTLWIAGRAGDATPYHFDAPLPSARVVAGNVPPALQAWLAAQPVELTVTDDLPDFALPPSWADTRFDDIILLDPQHAAPVAAAAERLLPRGTLNLVTQRALDGPVAVDASRLHYEHWSLLGCPGPAIDAAYGPARNRSDLRPGGVLLVVGAGGAMGRMHIQRALEMPAGPRAIIATNRGPARLRSLAERFAPLATAAGRELVAVSPDAEPERLGNEIERLTHGRGCDDVVVVVPDVAVMQEAVRWLAPDGMLVIFAGIPRGQAIDLPLDRTARYGAQFTGTSGSTVADQLAVLDKAVAGTLAPAGCVAAIGGMRVVKRALAAMMENRFPGKIVIYPHLPDLPLLGLDELRATLPTVHAALGPGPAWTRAAEAALLAGEEDSYDRTK